MMVKVSKLATSLLLLSFLTGCNADESVPPPKAVQSSQSPSSSPEDDTDVEPALLPSLMLNTRQSNVKVNQLLTVTVNNASSELKKVEVKGKRQGERGQAEELKVTLPGKAQGEQWIASSFMEPSTLYKVKAVLEDGTKLKERLSTQKLTLSQQTYATVYPAGVSNVGVAQPVVVRFDLPIQNRKEVEQALQVKSIPEQAGAWRWYSATEVRYRPRSYWKPGTRVTVDANLNSVPVGGGRYGQFDVQRSFEITRSERILKVDLDSKTLKAYRDGKLVKTIYISAGEEPAYTTRSGIKVIMSKNRYYDMNSSSIGIDPNSAEGYDLSDVEYAMRLTNSGEFLHAAPWNAGNFGRYNASHGCTGASTADMGWVYNFVNIGDPVEYVGTSRRMTPENGWGDWNLSWRSYKNA